jgi:hypothetical protein
MPAELPLATDRHSFRDGCPGGISNSGQTA